jgi:adenylylsulfate kinase-like enzyme
MAKDFMVKESELDDIQQRVLDQTLDRSCIVTGCAGSGKSVIAPAKGKTYTE